MAASIGSNISALVAQRQSLTRLSSGLRTNSAADDAAGLAVASSLSAKSRVYTQGIRNANDGISLLSIADGAQESAELVKRQILSQVNASVLAQANQAPALALQLLR